MKKVLFIFALSLFCAGKAFAQYDSPISHYMFFPAIYNPAMVGESGMIQLAGMHRINMASLDGGQVTNFGVNSPLNIKKTLHGVGFRIANRTMGSMRSYQSAYLQYAYKQKTRIGNFSLGVDLGFVNNQIDGSKVDIPSDGDYHNPNDPAIPTSEVSGMAFDMNIGAIYSFPGNKGYLGLSYAHLTSPTVELDDKIREKVFSTMYMTGGFQYAIPDTKLMLKPSALVMTDFTSYDWALTANLDYDDRIWGGLTYRLMNSVTFMVGANILGGVSAGFAYDLPASKRIIGTVGSFELMLEFNFEYVLNKGTKKYKSVRIL